MCIRDRYCIALHCIVLHCIALYCIALYCIVLCCTALHCIALYCVALHCIAMHCIALYCIVLYCIALYCIAFHYISRKLQRQTACGKALESQFQRDSAPLSSSALFLSTTTTRHFSDVTRGLDDPASISPRHIPLHSFSACHVVGFGACVLSLWNGFLRW